MSDFGIKKVEGGKLSPRQLREQRELKLLRGEITLDKTPKAETLLKEARENASTIKKVIQTTTLSKASVVVAPIKSVEIPELVKPEPPVMKSKRIPKTDRKVGVKKPRRPNNEVYSPEQLREYSRRWREKQASQKKCVRCKHPMEDLEIELGYKTCKHCRSGWFLNGRSGQSKKSSLISMQVSPEYKDKLLRLAKSQKTPASHILRPLIESYLDSIKED